MVIHLVLMKVRHFSLLQINYRQNQNSSRQILLMSISLAQEHANKASSLLTSNLTTEIAEENQRVANELTIAINDLQNISSSPQQVESVDQFVRNLEDILDEAVSIRIEQEDVENATIQALAFDDLVNSILENYGSGYAVDSDMPMMG